jgi:hypothetical protein
MASTSAFGGVLVILVLVILIVEEMIQGPSRQNSRGWLTVFRVAILPLFFAFVLIMLSRLILSVFA